MATTGAQILSTDLNTLRNKVSDVIGSGTGTFGYGQTVNSSTVISGQTVLKSHFDAIRFDIVNAYFHQNGLVPAATIAKIGDPISAGASDPFNGYNALADEIRSDRFDCDPGLLTVTPKATTTYTSAWSVWICNTTKWCMDRFVISSWFTNVWRQITYTFSSHIHAD